MYEPAKKMAEHYGTCRFCRRHLVLRRGEWKWGKVHYNRRVRRQSRQKVWSEPVAWGEAFV